MHLPYSILLVAAAAAALSWYLIGLYARAMRATQQLEAPNPRSMHEVPVPVGAGVAIVATIAVLSPWWQSGATGLHLMLLACLGGLCAVSWIDDCWGLSPAVRLATQAAAVALCLVWLPSESRLLPFLSVLAERLLLGLAWLWFINLFNFMDGIDGLAGSEAVAVGLGYLALVAFAGLDDGLWRLVLVMAAATGGYLAWNWHPAKVFMGDAGSIPLGFLLGWAMLYLALRGLWAAGLILPLYFVADATLTLLIRAARGEKPWHAHRQHFYQRAVLGGTPPPGVVWRVSAVNGALVALALVSISHPVAALIGAVLIVAGLLVHLEILAGRNRHDLTTSASNDA